MIFVSIYHALYSLVLDQEGSANLICTVRRELFRMIEISCFFRHWVFPAIVLVKTSRLAWDYWSYPEINAEVGFLLKLERSYLLPRVVLGCWRIMLVLSACPEVDAATMAWLVKQTSLFGL